MSKPNLIVRIFRGLWRLLGIIRQVVQVLVLLFFLAILVAVFSGGPPVISMPSSFALVISPSGRLVEQLEGDPLSRALAELQGVRQRETLVRDLREALSAAQADDRVKAVVLELSDFEGGGLTKLQSVAEAIRDVRAAGKKVIAAGDGYTQAQYYLAAQADEIYLNELGAIWLDGFGYYRAFFRDALDKLSIDVNVFRVGEYKSFVEPFTRDSMSPEDKEASRRWLEALWSAYRDDVAAARGLSPQELTAYVEGFADRVEAANGDLARVAVEGGLVDELANRGRIDDYLLELAGPSDSDEGWSGIDFRAYLAAVRREQPGLAAQNNVGVLVASGEIVDGQAPAGTVGGDTFAALVRQAAEDPALRALVLQVDSPGGSMFASELIYQELLALRETGRPLVVSMGSVAASGGYYIAMPAQKIFASPNTITGSIGVGAILPTFQRGLERLGVQVDGIGSTSLAGQLTPERELGPDARRVLQASVDEAYRVFVGKVAENREMSIDRADSLARGRVWVGRDALELGLVDEAGGLDAAIEAAAAAAGLAPGEYGVDYVERELSLREQLAVRFAVGGRATLAWLGFDRLFHRDFDVRRVLARLGDELAVFTRFNDPRGLYYHCFCAID